MGTKKNHPKAKQGLEPLEVSTGAGWLPDPRAILQDTTSTPSQRTAAQRVLELKPGEDFDLKHILRALTKSPDHPIGHFVVEERTDEEFGTYDVVIQKRADGTLLPLGGIRQFTSDLFAAVVQQGRLNCGEPINDQAGAFMANLKSFGEAILHIIRNFAVQEPSASNCTASDMGKEVAGARSGLLLEAVKTIREGKYVIALTGAGVSAESGVPTFRAGDDAIWNTVDARKFDLAYFTKHPKGFWMNLKPFRDSFANVQPNTGHRALAEMEALGFLRLIITQNVDGLHQAAGSKKVIEVHGNLRNVVCLSCKVRFPVEGQSWGKVPECPECGAVMKPDAVLFGEALPMKDFKTGLKAFQSCDVLLLVGTSGAIPPMNQAPQLAKDHGAKIIEINPESTPFTDTVTDIFLQGEAGRILYDLVVSLHLKHGESDPRIVDAIKIFARAKKEPRIPPWTRKQELEGEGPDVTQEILDDPKAPAHVKEAAKKVRALFDGQPTKARRSKKK